MDNQIKDLKTWAEAERYLARHGYGVGQIAEQKELWEATKTPKPAAAPVAPKPAVKSATKK